MQTISQLRELFDAEGLRPQKQFGQCFLIDRNLMDRLVATAELSGTETVLEVGPATGSLTEELLPRAKRVVAASSRARSTAD
ncbi:MAG: rRNA adenine N-6-methyltransferase family protein [Planctomycetota bacterium]|jgi:16S rRNA (adenine1518-N6/adenine1519-N6)-dimethyltransferase